MNAQPHIIKITMRRQESPLQILDGPQSLHNLQTSCKIHCHKHGPPLLPTEKYQDNKKIESTVTLEESLDVSPT